MVESTSEHEANMSYTVKIIDETIIKGGEHEVIDVIKGGRRS